MTNDDAVKACYLPPEFFYEFYTQLEANALSMDFLDKTATKRETNRLSLQSHK